MTGPRRWLILVIALVALAPASFAVQPDERLADPVLEARARALSEEIRCLVCQNQSIDDSEADLAHDLRVIVRERIKAGDSDEAVLAFLVARYGDYVLLKPPVKPSTYPLWFGPIVILGIGALGAALYLRRRRPSANALQLSSAEETRLSHLMGDGGDAGGGREDP
jgi:cytochrome c-type biogenesis protein CcmH